MKATKSCLLLLLILAISLPLVACADVEKTGLWENATYTRDKSFGKGEITFTLTVSAEAQSLTFTVKTDKDTLGEALREHELIEDENGLVHTVNGMAESLEEGGWYWVLTKGEEQLPASVDDIALENGDSFQFEIKAYDAIAKTGVWKDAIHVNNTILGDGEKTLTLTVSAEGQNLTFTVKTDKETLRQALEEHELIEGDESQFGLYVKKVNGILAEYEDGGYYWQIKKDGEATSTGVDGIVVADGEHYELIRTNTW